MFINRITPLKNLTAVRRFAAAAAETKTPKKKEAKFVPVPQKLYVTLSTPANSFFRNKEVSSVSVPAVDGMIEYLYQSVQSGTQLKPGPVLIKHTDGQIEKFFVSGGFAFVTKDSFVNVNAVEAVKFADLDPNEATKGLRQAEADMAAAATTEGKLKAQMEIETFSNVLLELGSKA